MDLIMIPEYMSNIMSFLDKNSLKSLVISSKKKDQDIIKKSLSRLHVSHIQVCEWTFRYKIDSVHSYVLEDNIKYVSNICKKLIILKSKRRNNYIKICNDNIEYLHVDCCKIQEIKSKTLKTLFLIYNQFLDVDVLENIILSCPSLNNLLLYSRTLHLTDEWINEMKEHNNKLKIKSRLAIIQSFNNL
jgi:hypothetical protein